MLLVSSTHLAEDVLGHLECDDSKNGPRQPMKHVLLGYAFSAHPDVIETPLNLRNLILIYVVVL